MLKPVLAYAADGMHNTGDGKTEITVTNADGTAATFKISCLVTQIGKQ